MPALTTLSTIETGAMAELRGLSSQEAQSRLEKSAFVLDTAKVPLFKRLMIA
jgi:hypothetical protein